MGAIETVNLGGWDILFYLLIFIYGYYFFSNDGFKPALRKTVKLHFAVAIITSLIFIPWFMISYPKPGSIGDIVFYAVHTLNCWSWLLCIFFAADKYLTRSNGFLKYGSEASMPFYVLHQPIIVLFGYLIYDLSWPLPVKLVFLLVSSFAVIMLCYHFVIRKVKALRFLFGMKGTRGKRRISTDTKISLD